MELHPIFQRYPELRQFILLLQHEMQQAQRPANQIVLDDQRVMKILGISERKLDYIKEDKLIPFSQEKPRAKCYWLLSDILNWINKNRIESTDADLKIK